jgi:hypothetical protein
VIVPHQSNGCQMTKSVGHDLVKFVVQGNDICGTRDCIDGHGFHKSQICGKLLWWGGIILVMYHKFIYLWVQHSLQFFGGT